MTVRAKTRAQMAAELEDLRGRFATLRTERDAAIEGGKQLRANLDDVKERLAFAEVELQRTRGYIERVQEDDVVREELVTIGEPEGEQRLVPKRKPTHFPGFAGGPEKGDGCRNMGSYARGAYPVTEAPRRNRHWVTY